MKKLLLIIAVLVFWLSASGQGKGQILQGRSFIASLIQNFHLQPDVIISNTDKALQRKVPKKSSRIVMSSLLSPVQILDSAYSWQWEPSFLEWKYDYRIKEFTYNDKNKLISAVEQEWNDIWWIWDNSSRLEIVYDNRDNPISLTVMSWDSTWVNDIQFLYTYDGNNNKTSEVYREYYDNIWHDIGLYSLTYDAFNNITSETSQYWQEGILLNEYRNVYEYDNHNNLIRNLYQSGYYVTWSNSSQHTYTYDADNLLVTDLYQYWQNNTWQTSAQSLYTYDLNHNLTGKLDQSWNAGMWENYKLNSYLYDSYFNRISDVEQLWNGSIWNNSFQYLFTYDSHNNQTSDLTQKWMDTSWVSKEQNTHLYDTDNFIISETSKYFYANGIDVQYGDSTHNYFYTLTNIRDFGPAVNPINIYPNPCNGKVTISSGIALEKIEVYNLLGQLVYSTIGSPFQNKYEIDLTGNPKGTYILLFYNNKNKSNKMIMVQ